MTFSLHVPTDGHGVIASDITMSFLEGSLSMSEVYKQIKLKPVEFEISPWNGILMPLSEIDIQVQLIVLFELFYLSIPLDSVLIPS